MDATQDYRRFAQECMEVARTVHNPETRETMLRMAQIWLRLAEEHAAPRDAAP
jgi:hypothetical protein